jgi:hypothetical protein
MRRGANSSGANWHTGRSRERPIAVLAILTQHGGPSDEAAPMTSKNDPWHAITHNVHHTSLECSEGKKLIAPAAIRDGTGGRPLCPECEKLAQADAAAKKAKEKS